MTPQDLAAEVKAREAEIVYEFDLEEEDGGVMRARRNLAHALAAAEAERDAALERVRYADAVGRVWIVGLMDGADTTQSLRACAHPLAMVRGALAGEQRAIELGCDERELALALEHSDIDDYRRALGGSDA